MTMSSANAGIFIKDGSTESHKRHSIASSLDSWDGVFDYDCENSLANGTVTGSVNSPSTAMSPTCCKSHHSEFLPITQSSVLKKAVSGKDKGVKHKKQTKSHNNSDKYISSVLGNSENSYVASKPSTAVSNKTMINSSSSKAQNSIPFERKFKEIRSAVLRNPMPVSKPPKGPLVPISQASPAEKPAKLIRQVSLKSGSLPLNSSLSKNFVNSKHSTGIDQTEKMKTKLLSVWNNVKYGWTMPTRTNFTVFSPAVLLGQVYHDVDKDNGTSSNKNYTFYNGASPHRLLDSPIEKFKLDFTSRIWLTYRRDYPPFNGSTLTTDCGWGCMLRGGQMLLAQALLCHFLSRSWRCSGVPQTESSETLHRTIIKWFADCPSDLCPLSLHHLVEIGRQSGKEAGDWYGPASVAHILKQAIEDASKTSPLLDKVCVYVAQDCTVYEEDVIKLCTAPSHVTKIEKSHEPLTPTTPTVPNTTCILNKPELVSLSSCEEVIEWADVLKEEERSNSKYQPNSTLNWNTDIPSPPLSPFTACRTWSNPLMNDCGLDSFGENTTKNYCSVPPDVRPCHEMKTNGLGEKWRGLIILIPVRLGGEKLNSLYIPCLKRILAHESCLGIIGGKPRHALYFVGFQDDKLIHLDPHYCQEAVDIRSNDFSLNTFHCNVPKKIPLAKMDPSCTLGFYLRTRDDFEAFTSNITPLLIPAKEKLEYPVFVVTKGSRKTIVGNYLQDEDLEASTHDNSSDNESEAFVLL